MNDARYIIFFFNFLTPLLSLSLSLLYRGLEGDADVERGKEWRSL